jgi:hypothetical protein
MPLPGDGEQKHDANSPKVTSEIMKDSLESGKTFKF